jgi:hypothetical protein
MLLKNINNLIVELGMLGLQMFLIDLRRDLLEKQSDKFRQKGKKIIEIFNSFIDEMVVKDSSNHSNMFSQMMAERKAKIQDDKEKIEDINEVSGKVTELVNILETEQA